MFSRQQYFCTAVANSQLLSDSIQCGPEINVANTAAKTISCNDIQPDNSQVINISPRNNGNPSSFKTPASLNKNNTSPMIIEIPSSKQIPRNSHNDYRNKPKTLIQQSNKNQSSNPKSQTIPLGKPLPNAIHLALFFDVVAGVLREIDAILCTQSLSTIITTPLHLILSHKKMDFPQLGTLIYLAMAYIMTDIIPLLFYPITEDR